MTPGKLAAVACLLALLFFPPCPLMAESSAVDDTGVSWAYGTIVDSVTVTGNKHTRTFVILREMETQPGEVLDRETLRRDIRFLNDMTPFSNVSIRADSLGPGHCALRIDVRERSEILIKAILPLLKYDFERGITYGVRWNNKNFRGRLENLIDVVGPKRTRRRRGELRVVRAVDRLAPRFRRHRCRVLQPGRRARWISRCSRGWGS